MVPQTDVPPVSFGLGRALSGLSSSAVTELLAKTQTVIVPFGAVEQHGPALPTGTDAMIAQAISAAVSEKTGAPYAEAIPLGLSAFHMAFAGTISLSVETYSGLVRDVLKSLVEHGFRRQLIVNAHFENSGVIRAVAEELAHSSNDLAIMVCDFWDMPSAKAVAERCFNEPGGHADAADAALMLYIRRELVSEELFTKEWPQINSIVSPDLIGTYVTSSGVIGSDQRTASAARGQEYFSAIVDDMCERIDHLSRL